MGLYVNPGNRAFAEIADRDYVDKTGLIGLINRTMLKKNKLTCVSRPRRFGKSYAAKMLTAYYDCTCDSRLLFDHRKIAKTKGYQDHLNQYNVICLDISGFVSEAKSNRGDLRDIPEKIKSEIRRDLEKSGFITDEADSLNDILVQIAEAPDGKPFVFIIDEWDSLIREARDDLEAQDAYLSLLRGWFKNNNFTPRAVAAAYMTGILPIRKDGSQTAISDFRELSMLNPGEFGKYTGFTEGEVKRICRNRLSFEDVKSWYDGYEVSGTASIYNPYSVMNAISERQCRSFWGATSAAEGLTDYIQLNYDGLQETIANLITGANVDVRTDGFQNDLERLKSRDDVLTLLIHLGYLTYDSETKTVHIPNEEVRREFYNFLGSDDVGKLWAEMKRRSDQVLDDTIHGREENVAAALEEIHEEQYAPQFYINEQSLRAIIKYAFLSAIPRYVRIEEMSSGKGIADVAFIPTPASRMPAMLVELKWDLSSGGAIQQIKEGRYTAALKPFIGNLVLCGINYDSRSKKHTCKIESV